MKIPQGKTEVIATSDSHQCEIKMGDVGYIDGYVRGGDDRPYAVFVRLSDGKIDLAPAYLLKAR